MGPHLMTNAVFPSVSFLDPSSQGGGPHWLAIPPTSIRQTRWMEAQFGFFSSPQLCPYAMLALQSIHLRKKPVAGL